MHAISTRSSILRSSRVLSTGLAIFCVLTVLSIWRLHPRSQIPYITTQNNTQEQSPQQNSEVKAARINDVRNSSLGFEKIFVVNLAERTDKLDQFALVSSLTGFRADVVPGVKGHEILNKSLPTLDGLPEKERSRDNRVGCWRAHLNCARTIVAQGLSTALVMEDDADWDIGLKDQLDFITRGSQFVSSVKPGEHSHSPYGDDWDLLWLGHCGNSISPDHQRRFIIENDATVPAKHRQMNFVDHPDMAQEGYENSTRVVYRAKQGCCLYAYALSYRGAQKLLRDQARMTWFNPIDLAIGAWCQDNPDVMCVGVFPQIFDSHKGPGRINRDSDMGPFQGDTTREKGFTFNIVHSARLNVDRLLAGELDMIESQWPEDPEVVGPPRPKPEVRVPKHD